MNQTGHVINGKPLAVLSLGCLRFAGRENAGKVVKACVENEVLYLDTSPAYCYQTEEENSETWVGEAIRGMRDKVILSTKCSSGDGVDAIGGYNPSYGFSITTADQVRRQIEQSLKRLNVDRFDFYQLWSVHNELIFKEAFKKGGWMEGVQKAKEEGLLKHIGITGHDGNEGIFKWIGSGYFEMITVPFNLFDISRLESIHRAVDKGLAVMLMNPVAGGCLSQADDTVHDVLADIGVSSVDELALRFCGSIPGVSVLCGMSAAWQASKNSRVLGKPLWTEEKGFDARSKFLKSIEQEGNACIGCDSCLPCPKGIDIPGNVCMFNYYRHTKLSSVKKYFQERYDFLGNGYKTDRCDLCGLCEERCPNQVKVGKYMQEIAQLRKTDVE